MRPIDKIIDSSDVMMGKYKIGQPLPTKGIRQVDPFLLIHHAGPKIYQPGDSGLYVEADPHRGFEPVTFVFDGEVEHYDSLGNQSIIGINGVQWINAGRGIVHSEKASKKFVENGGLFEIIQVWINLPKSLKYSDPSYIGINHDNIPKYISKDEKVRINIIAGGFNGLKGPIPSQTGIIAYSAFFEKEGHIKFEFEDSYNIIIYQLDGRTTINDRKISAKQLVVFKREGKNIIVKCIEKSKLLILAGIPIKEPLFQYGPFVLNSKEEAIQAINDYESGKMGYLT